tara:strand:- start:447 stop:686 length:240 start_codon:yes stop_codon:yes gene_type:complete
MTSLTEYSQSNPSKAGSVAWRDLNESNRAAWVEACEGVKSGNVTAATAAKWLKEHKDCPLTVDSIRCAIRNTMEHYVKS